MESDKNFGEISQLERVATLASSPFSMMDPSTLPLSPNLSQVWKQPYLMNHFENGESIIGAETHFQPFDTHHTATATLIPTPTTTTTTTTTPPEVEAIQDKGKKFQEESDSDANHGNGSKTVTVKTEKEETVYDTLIGGPLQIRVGRNIAPESLDPKKLKRIYSNRVSAQKSRLKKLQYIAEMEKKAKALEAQVAVLSPQVEFFKNQSYFLQMERVALNESIAARAAERLNKAAQIEANKKEVQRLRLLHLQKIEQQQMQLQASMYMNMDGVESMDQKLVNNPAGFTQSELGNNMLYSSDSKKGQSFEKAPQENLQNQINDAEKPDVKPSLGVAAVGGNKELKS
uniref:basic leucine zipper 61-like n=1 Tax=Fragaria vesca subsp. vesca TaxID=101020 RepID=UPI0005C9A02B|nr:PREDICTED: basic leucine zipper 61-like [Fragaria vesca subsp. vesca]